jgi:CBS domain-containing protein
MSAIGESDNDFTETFEFDHAKDNFLRAAQFGLGATCTWINGKEYKAKDLIRRRLLPMAREGLQEKGIAKDDIDRYLGLIDDRTKSGQTGAKWALSSMAAMGEQATYDERARAIVLATIDRQREDAPVHKWRLAALDETKDWRDSYQVVSQFMSTDLFTMRPEDLLDLAASVMDWEHIRHVPVEDEEGRLVGIITMRDLLVHAARRRGAATDDADGKPTAVSVGAIMNTALVTVSPEHLTVDALRLMRDKKVGCLPVVDEEQHLVGLVTDNDLLKVAAFWMEEQLLSLE